MTELAPTDLLDRLFAGDGEMARLMRSHDWSQTPLGSIEQWPQSLRTTVSILLSTRHPMFLFWGAELVQFYNDGYRPSLGAQKHPQALGQRGAECWAEIWHIIGPQIQNVMTRGEETWHEDQLIPFDRNGYFEEIYFTYSYSPVRDETGGVGGTLVVCTETTQQVLSNRRLQTLRELGANGMKAKTVENACEIATHTLAVNPYDIPFALLYRIEPDSQPNNQPIRLVGATGIEGGTEASPMEVNFTQNDRWGLAQVYKTGQAMVVDDLASRFQTLPGGIWDTPPASAFVIPIAQPGQDTFLAGVLILGISPRRKFDDGYRDFFNLVASNIATAITNAAAYEAERQRAEALAEIDRAKTIFFSNVSHEFRTPLTLLLAPTEDALADTEATLPDIQRDRIEIVQRNGRRLLKLVNTLLDFSRMEAGRIQAVYEPTDLATFTADLASTFRSLIERAGMTLVVECASLPEPVYVDREMWEKIVLNLLSNAFKFTLTGRITVRLQACQDQIELTIADTGIGIPSDEILYLFDRFHRVRGAQGRSFEGSGIGLSLVQELVKLHGGNIQVTSQPGQGSCITVSIPTGTAHLPAERIGVSCKSASTAMGATPYIEEAERWLPEEDAGTQRYGDARSFAEAFPPSPRLSFPTSPSSTAHILVVDDNADVRQYVKRLLKPYYTVETAPDGVEALTAIRCCLPDLVLTDGMMPRLDGFGLLRELRADPNTRELPIILLSARAGEEARVEGLEAGADDYLTKPFSSRELMARVEASLKMAQIRREAALQEQALRLAAEQAQQETAKTFKRLTQLLETMSDAFVALDQDWRITYQNAAAEQINNGKPRSQVLGKTHWEEWPNSVGTELEYHYRRAMAEQVPVHFEYHYYFPPDFDVWLEVHAYPAEEGLGIFFRDITDRKQAEAALQESQLQLQRQLAEIETIYQSAPIGLNVLDTNLRFVRLNQRLAEMNGLSVEAHLGRTVREVLPELADAAEKLLRPILETGEPLLNVEINGETPAQPGVQRTWLEHFLPLKDGDRIIGISTVCEEITDRKRHEAQRQQAEAALRRAKEELELRVAERTMELQETNDRLQQELFQRARVEHQLRQSESRHRAIVEDQTEMIARFSSDSTMLFANDAYCRYFGVQQEEIIGQSYNPIIYEEDREQVAQLVQSMNAQHPMLTIENRVIDGRGEIRWTQWVNRMLFDTQGKLIEFQAVGRDITELKQIEQALRNSEERLQLALEASGDGIWDWNIATSEVYFNPQYFQMLGYEADELPQLVSTWEQLVHPDDMVWVKEILAAHLQDNSVRYEFDYRLQTKSGDWKWIADYGKVVAWDEQGNPLRMIGTHRDVSDRKQAEVALRESDRRWRSLLDNVQLVVIGLDSNGNVEYANPFFLELSGYQLQDVLGQSWFDSFLSPGQKSSVEIVFREVLEHNFHTHYQNPILTRSGEERMIAWNNTLLRDASGQAIGTISIGEDITERSKVERMKAEFISVVSHELRTPLTSMQAALSLLSEKIIDPTSAEGEATIHIATEGTDRLVRLVNDILDLERLESGKMRLTKCLCTVNDLVETAIAQMQEMANQVRIALQANSSPFQIEADGDRLIQVLTNLLSNAIKFSPNDSTVWLRVESIEQNREGLEAWDTVPDPPAALLFTVRDQGRGIPAHNLESIFERFHQVDASDSREKEGTGLGLAICRSIVRQHGGAIWAESTIGEGSTFYFTIPMIGEEKREF